MNIILLKHVKKLGKIGDIVKVANGYARNFLLPQNICVTATEENKKIFESQKHEIEAKNLNDQVAASKYQDAINNKEVTFICQTSDDGKLFGSVTAKQIADMLNKQYNANIKYTQVALSTPLKHIGIFNMQIHLHHDVDASIIVNVARSKTEAQEFLTKFKNISEQNQSDKEENFLSPSV